MGSEGEKRFIKFSKEDEKRFIEARKQKLREKEERLAGLFCATVEKIFPDILQQENWRDGIAKHVRGIFEARGPVTYNHSTRTSDSSSGLRTEEGAWTLLNEMLDIVQCTRCGVKLHRGLKIDPDTGRLPDRHTEDGGPLESFAIPFPS